MAPTVRRLVRVGGVSGGFSDRVQAMASPAKDDVDVIVGNWLSEMTMTMHETGKLRNKEQMLQARSFEEKLNYAMFASNFRVLNQSLLYLGWRNNQRVHKRQEDP